MNHRVQDQQPPTTSRVTADGKQSRRPGCIAQVGSKTGLEPRTPVDRKAYEDQKATCDEDRAEPGTEPGPPAAGHRTVREQMRHRRTRPSSGRRPTRTITR